MAYIICASQLFDKEVGVRRFASLFVSLVFFYFAYLSWNWIFTAGIAISLVAICSLIVCASVGIILFSASFAPTPEQVSASANKRLAYLNGLATRLGYKPCQKGTYSASAYIRPSNTNHYFSGRLIGQTKDTMEDTLISVVAGKTYGFFLSDANSESEYGIRCIRYLNLFIVVDERGKTERYYIYTS